MVNNLYSSIFTGFCEDKITVYLNFKNIGIFVFTVLNIHCKIGDVNIESYLTRRINYGTFYGRKRRR